MKLLSQYQYDKPDRIKQHRNKGKCHHGYMYGSVLLYDGVPQDRVLNKFAMLVQTTFLTGWSFFIFHQSDTYFFMNIRAIVSDPTLRVKYKAFEDIKDHLKAAGQLLGLKKKETDLLLKPDLQLVVNFSIVMDNRRKQYFEGYLLIFPGVYQDVKGVIKLSPEINLNATQATALLHTMKMALWEEKGRAAAGGIICDPTLLSDAELTRLIKEYNRVTTDEYARHSWGSLQLQVDPCLPITDHTEQQPDHTSLPLQEIHISWLSSLIDRGMKDMQINKEKRTIALYGFTAKDQLLALQLFYFGYKIVALAQDNVAYFSPYGIDIPNLINYSKFKNGDLKGYPNAIPTDVSGILAYDVASIVIGEGAKNIDLLANKTVRTSLIVETGDQKISYLSEQAFAAKGIRILPDIITNFLPYDLNRKDAFSIFAGDKDEVFAARLLRKFREIDSLAETHKISLRSAAYLFALERKHCEQQSLQVANNVDQCA